MLAAAMEGNTERLISALRYIRNIDFVDDLNETALHKAVYRGHSGIAELLLGKGASTEAINKDNNTPLQLAIGGGYINIVELLLGKGASTEAIKKDNEILFRRAIKGGYVGVVGVLLGKGASTGAMDGTVLHCILLHRVVKLV